MARLLHDKQIENDEILSNELKRLITALDGWEPVGKGSKDLKYRLEPVRANL